MAPSMSLFSCFPLYIMLLLALALAHCSLCSMDIFILAGQSNMAGRGGVRNGKFWDKNVPPECRPNPSILRLNSELRWEPAREPLHADIDVGKTCGVGPGMSFANEVLRRVKWEKTSNVSAIGLVPCAKGGSKIVEWGKGMRLYDELVRRVSATVTSGVGVGVGRVRGLLWYQGESDTVREEDALSYRKRFEEFVVDLREDLRLPSLLVIQVALASGEGKFIEKVREAQLGTRLPNVKYVDAKGLPLKADKLHLTTMSQVHLGIRLAHAYIASITHHQFNHSLKLYG